MSSLNSDATVRYRKLNDHDVDSEVRSTNLANDENSIPPVSFEGELNPFNQQRTSSSAIEGNDQSNNYDLSRVLKNIYNQIDQLKYRLQRDTYRRCINNEWMLIGSLVDKILFFTYCIVVIVSTNLIFKY